MHLLLWAEDSAEDLRAELARSFPGTAPQFLAPVFLRADFPVPAAARLPHLAYARQWLPHARTLHATSIRGLATELCEGLRDTLPDGQPWALHVASRYGLRSTHHIGARAWHSATRRRGAPGPGPEGGSEVPRREGPEVESQLSSVSAADAGRQRARLVRETTIALLQRKRRHLRRQLHSEPAAFAPADSLVQLVLTAPDTAFLSIAPAPLPFEQRHLLSPFPAGDVPIASDKAAPSRAFAKLVEAELRLGRGIGPGETCVDLGAAPGSWTYVAVGRGARVTAVDRSPLRDDLLRHPRVVFEPGDAFRFASKAPVDWLLCDVIAAPERTAALLVNWLRQRWCRRFIVTLKTGDTPGADTLQRLKEQLPPLTRELFLTRLCANKKEVCAFGTAA